ncbi:MAG TPA: hypothetical protein DD727_02690 [Clostridiales bacterium]|nr:hypothetical protein [Clostridiales bacterium]
MTTRKGDTWDLAVQLLPRKLSLGSLFQPGTPYRRIILEEIRRQALLNIAQGNDIYFEDVEKNIIQYFDPKNYYLVPEGVAVYYPLYSLAPYAAGILVFVIDYSIFGDSLVYRLPGA